MLFNVGDISQLPLKDKQMQTFFGLIPRLKDEKNLFKLQRRILPLLLNCNSYTFGEFVTCSFLCITS